MEQYKKDLDKYNTDLAYEQLIQERYGYTVEQYNNWIERDYNAALNILDEGLRIIGCSTSEFTLVDYPTTERWQHGNVLTVDDRLSNEVLKSSDRLKQEVNNGQTSLFKF